MATEKQIAANKANAKKSTGPTSEEGKAISRLNALTHGLTGGQVVVIPGESALLYGKLLSELMLEYDPQTALQEELVRQVANTLWRLRRVPLFEAAIFNACCTEVAKLNWPSVEDQELSRWQHSLRTGLSFIDDPKTLDALGKLTRHEMALSNSLKRTLKMLEDSGANSIPWAPSGTAA